LSKKPIILVDGSSYLYRAYHALPKLSTSDGQPTGVIYGVASMLRKLVNEYEPSEIVVVFDAKGKTFRHERYPEYKAHRPPMPDDLREQIEPLHELVDAMGLPRLVVPGVEADDVIGTLARQASAAGHDALISTGDKDLAQLVDKHVTLINTMNDSVLDPDGVKQKFGVSPEHMVDLLALVGDSSDNIPGVHKVGPKTALKLLDEYGDLDSLVAQADAVSGKVGEYLRNGLDQLALSRELVTIRCDLELPGALDMRRRPPDREQLQELFTRFEFTTWLDQLGGERPTQDKPDYEMIVDEAVLDRWLERLAKAERFAFDTETTSLDITHAEIVGVSFADADGAAYVPLAHDYPDAPQQLDREMVLERLRPLLEDPQRPKVGQNLKYDISVLAHYGIQPQGVAYDTMLESYILDSTASRHDMDSLALKYLGRRTIKFEDVAGKGKGQIRFNDVAVEQAVPYAAEDAEVTLALHEALWPRLAEHPRLVEVFRTIEMPLVPVLARIEQRGVRIDAGMLRKQSSELAKRMMEIEREAHDLAGQPFNMSSPKQIQEILFDKLKLPVLEKTPKGQPSTSESVLRELANDFPLPQRILDHRSLAKLKSTYTDKLPEMINPQTGRVHTSYHQAVAATGRLSSSDPNLQNIPIRTAEGRRIREAFVPEQGACLISADYSQIELRIMAHLSQDETLCAAFIANQDVHRATAAEVFAVDPDEVDTEQRRAAKAINFGLIYGMSAFGLARQLKIDRAAAQEYVKLYFLRYPGVKNYMDETRALAHERGYVETVYGRRLYLPEINASNHTRRQYAERTAINAPMQGTAADLIKLAMLAVDRWIRESGSQSAIIMQVHDELVLESPLEEHDATLAALRECMTGVAKLSVPLVVEVASGANWNEAH
jgi:DNA polymerase-1